MTDTPRQSPVVIELDGPAESPAQAPPVPDDTGLAPAPETAAMQTLARMAGRRGSRLGAWVLGLATALVGLVVSVGFWSFAQGLIARAPVLGWVAVGLAGALVAVLVVLAGREALALLRLSRVDHLRAEADAALAHEDLGAARALVARLERFYGARPELRWALARLDERKADVFDADALLALTETELLAPLDAAAAREIELAARQVATVTAVVPLALADVAAALAGNLRMIRRIAEIYGGRSGLLGGWRLTRAVMAHLVATGAVAVGDDLVGSVAGGSVLSKLSRRFGEGVVNGALTARVGLAALEVCRPMPFRAARRPSVGAVVRRALAGLFGVGAKPPEG